MRTGENWSPGIVFLEMSLLSQATFSSSQAISFAYLLLPPLYWVCHCIQFSVVSGSVHLQCDKLRNCVQVASLQLIGTNRFVDNISHILSL